MSQPNRFANRFGCVMTSMLITLAADSAEVIYF